MKALKKLFGALLVLIIAVFTVVLICAMNPSMTQSLATILYGDGNVKGLLEKPDKEEQQTQENTVGTLVLADLTYELTGEVTDVPDNVAGLNGYQPIFGQQEEIGEAEAGDSLSEVGEGETGEDLTFDEEMYPYYSMLDEDGQKIYRQILANAKALQAAFTPVTAVSVAKLQDCFEAVMNDHPELFYVESSYTVKYLEGGNIVEVDLAYYDLADRLEEETERFEAAAQNIVTAAEMLAGDYPKEKLVHDALITTVEYRDGAAYDQSAYSALVGGETVCAGYARAFQYVMQKLGIPCYYCTGMTTESHAWNIVKLSDGYYNVDATWDDTDPSTYDYFNRTDVDYAGNHVRTSLSVKLPACTGTLYRGLEDGTAEVAVEDDGTIRPQIEDYSFYINDDPAKPLRYPDHWPNTGYVDTSPGGGSGNGGSSGNGSGGNAGTGGGGSSGQGGGSGTADGSGEQSQTPTLEETLSSLGLTDADVEWTLNDYYADCLSQMVAAGSGQQHFSNVVPETLFNRLESEYGTGAYETGYVNAALKTLGMDHFNILLEAQNLGKGYYRLYHNVNTWTD